jgi:hypothetical protein
VEQRTQGQVINQYTGGSGENYRLEDVATALIKSGGVHRRAAEILAEAYGRKCTRQTVYNYLKRHPELREVLEESREASIDQAESQLLDAVERGDINAIKFYLETKGKLRGYTRRQEITGAEGRPIEVTNARQSFIADLTEMAARLRTVPSGAISYIGPNGSGEPAKDPDE